MEVEKNRVYRHFKGDYYLVVDIAYNASDLKKQVIYRSLYQDGKLWVRDYDDFISKVDKNKYPNIEQEYRFKLCNIESKNK